jgi:hypothetical protein
LALSIGIFILRLTRLSRQLHREQRETQRPPENENEIQQMGGNIQEIFWSLDVQGKMVLFVNQAYKTITGRTCRSLVERPSSYEEVVHHEDRGYVRTKMKKQRGRGVLMKALACPSCSYTTLGDTPAAGATVAAVWRRW